MVYMIATCIFMYFRYMIIPRYWYWYSRYWIRELLICDVWNPTSFVSRFSLSCSMLSIKLRSCYHVTCTMHCTYSWYTVYFKYNKYNLEMGRLDGWLDLIGWMYWIHIYPTTGDGSATYQLYIAPWALVSRFVLPLSGGPWSQQPGVHLRPWSRVCTGYTHSIRALRPLDFQLI